VEGKLQGVFVGNKQFNSRLEGRLSKATLRPSPLMPSSLLTHAVFFFFFFFDSVFLERIVAVEMSTKLSPRHQTSTDSLGLEQPKLVSLRKQLEREATRLSRKVQKCEKSCEEWNVVSVQERLLASSPSNTLRKL
jgi:hypothetical protein